MEMEESFQLIDTGYGVVRFTMVNQPIVPKKKSRGGKKAPPALDRRQFTRKNVKQNTGT